VNIKLDARAAREHAEDHGSQNFSTKRMAVVLIESFVRGERGRRQEGNPRC